MSESPWPLSPEKFVASIPNTDGPFRNWLWKFAKEPREQPKDVTPAVAGIGWVCDLLLGAGVAPMTVTGWLSTGPVKDTVAGIASAEFFDTGDPDYRAHAPLLSIVDGRYLAIDGVIGLYVIETGEQVYDTAARVKNALCTRLYNLRNLFHSRLNQCLTRPPEKSGPVPSP